MRRPASGVLYPLVVHTSDISPVAVPYLIKTSIKLAILWFKCLSQSIILVDKQMQPKESLKYENYYQGMNNNRDRCLGRSGEQFMLLAKCCFGVYQHHHSTQVSA